MRTHTDPALIRRGLDIFDESSGYAAAKALGVSHRTIFRWVDRRKIEGPQWPTPADIEAWRVEEQATRDYRAHNAKKAIEYRKRIYLNRGPVMIPAVGTVRRLRALYALGWTYVDMAERLGVTAARVGHIATERYTRVMPETVAKVAELYRELWMVTPIDEQASRRGAVRVHERARRDAKRRGWAPPMAWDDGAIDDPDATPQGMEPTKRPGGGRSTEETVEDVEYLLRHDPLTTATNLAPRLGYRDGSGLQNALKRAGRNDLLDRLARNAELAGFAVTSRRTA